jgi:hypothetical protein
MERGSLMILFDAANTLAPTSPTIPTGLGVAILSAYGMDLIKRLKQFPKVTYYSAKLNSLIRLGAAAAGTLGVSFTWSKLGGVGAGYQFVTTIPGLSVLALGAYHLAVQYGLTNISEIILAQREVAKQAKLVQAMAPKIEA